MDMNELLCLVQTTSILLYFLWTPSTECTVSSNILDT